jgi:hypothetical protein
MPRQALVSHGMVASSILHDSREFLLETELLLLLGNLNSARKASCSSWPNSESTAAKGAWDMLSVFKRRQRSDVHYGTQLFDDQARVINHKRLGAQG